MIRFLIPLVLILINSSCSEKMNSDYPLFYQMSDSDSAKCMNQILDGILETASENRRVEVDFFKKYAPVTCHQRMTLSIDVNSKGDIRLNMGSDSLSIQENVFQYFTFNRNLTSSETVAAATNSSSPHFEFPFFNRFGLEEIEQKIEETTAELNEVKKVPDADPAYIDYFASKVEEWVKRKRVLTFLDIDELPEIARYVRVSVDYRKTSPKVKEVLNEVALAFYQLLNYQSMIYFHEAYLSLYERAKRKKRKIDLKKLEAIEMLQPILFYDVDRSKPSSSWEEAPLTQ